MGSPPLVQAFAPRFPNLYVVAAGDRPVGMVSRLSDCRWYTGSQITGVEAVRLHSVKLVRVYSVKPVSIHSVEATRCWS